VQTVPVLLAEVALRIGFRLATGGLALLVALVVCLGTLNLAAGAVDQVITVRLEGTERYVAREREALAEVTRQIDGARQAGVAPSPDDLAEARFHEAEVYDKEMALASVYATWLLAFMPVYVTVVLAVLVPLWRLDPLAIWSQSRARLARRRRPAAGPAPESGGATGAAGADPPRGASAPQSAVARPPG
jgi:hypothetical protein